MKLGIKKERRVKLWLQVAGTIVTTVSVLNQLLSDAWDKNALLLSLSLDHFTCGPFELSSC